MNGKTNSKGFSVRASSFQMPFGDNIESCEGAGEVDNSDQENEGDKSMSSMMQTRMGMTAYTSPRGKKISHELQCLLPFLPPKD